VFASSESFTEVVEILQKISYNLNCACKLFQELEKFSVIIHSVMKGLNKVSTFHTARSFDSKAGKMLTRSKRKEHPNGCSFLFMSISFRVK
jgi:hypothetical protein